MTTFTGRQGLRSRQTRHQISASILAVVLMTLGSTGGRAAENQVVPGQVPAVIAARNLQSTGQLPGNQQLKLAIGLPLRNRPALDQLVQQIYTPASPNYRQYLTPAQFAAQFGPTVADYQAVINFAQANGLKVTGQHPNRTLVDVVGSVANIEKAFHVTLRVYPHPTEKRNFFAPDANPSVALAVPLLTINGLDNYALPRPLFRLPPAQQQNPQFGQNGTLSGSGPSGNYWGRDFRNSYAPGAPQTGAGQSVALFECDGYFTNDIASYVSQAGLSSVALTNVLIDGYNGIATVGDGANVEVALDIEMAISMAPGLSKILVYEGADDTTAIDLDILNRIANDNLAKQISSSWIIFPSAANDQIYRQFAAQGQSFFQACGDEDAYYPNIFQYQDSAYAILVGGTTLTMTDTGVAWSAETVWNWGSGQGTGGGISTNVPIPSWQQGISMTANGGSTVLRNIPDVALTADGVYVVADSGLAYTGVGGTSCAAPLWAAFTALINQQAAASGAGSVGFINPAVYSIGQSTNYSNCFHDITTGNNESPTSLTQFVAVAGYDLCTGWGTPTGTNLINALVVVAAHPLLSVAGIVISGGNGNGVVDTNECNQISLLLQNFETTASNITATITTTAGGVTVVQSSSSYPNVSRGSIGTNATPFQICTTNSAFICGTPITLTLHVSYTGGSNTLTYTLPDGFCPPIASFTATPTNGPTPLTTTFTDTSLGTVTNRFWNFGDGATLNTTALSISHTYTATGTVSVTLIATGPLGGSTNIQHNLITIRLGPLDHFAWGAIAATQYQNTPFPVSLIAQDAGNDTVTNFTGTVALSAASGTVGGGTLMQNGGFETGDFTGWTLSGNTDFASVSADPIAAHSGTYGAEMGPAGSLGFLSQSIATTPGVTYFVSCWLDSPDGATPNEFSVSWNGISLFDQTNIGALGWTNLQFSVIASGTSAVLQFGFRDDPAYLGLDDISVVPVSIVTSITPTNSGNFVSGVWTGAVTVLQVATNVVLNALDGSGHFGTSTVFNVYAPGVFAVTPTNGLTAAGPQGGSFSPASRVYTLTNTGASSLSWKATNATTWVSLSATNGSLAAGSSTTVTVSINANANSLPVGSDNDTVVFTNLTTATGSTTRAVSLTINPVLTAFQTWELQYFGCTNCPQAAPGADPLGKGINNSNQFLLGLNPTNAASVFRIASAVPTGANYVVTWKTAGRRTNVVQAANGGPGGYSNNFQDISGPVIINIVGDTITNYTDVGGATNRPLRFYRVRLGP